MFYISQLLDKNKFSGSISKYVDLDDYVIRNGYLFNKYTGELIDKYSIFDIITERNYMILDEMMYLNPDAVYGTYSSIHKEVKNTILADNNDKAIYYFFDNSTIRTLYICHTKNREIISIPFGNLLFAENDDVPISSFLGQDDDCVYFFSNSYNRASSGNYCAFFKFDKKLKKMQKILHIGGTSIYHDFEMPYITKGRYPNEIMAYYIIEGEFYFTGIDLIQNTKTIEKKITLTDVTGTNSSHKFYTKFVPLQESNDIYFVKKSTAQFNSDFVFYKFSKETSDIEKMTVDTNLMIPLKTESGNHYFFKTFTIERKGKLYLLFAITLNVPFKNFEDDITKRDEVNGINLYLFEINGDSLNLIDIYKSKGVAYTSLIYREDTDLLIWANYKNVHFIKINENMKFESIYHHYGLFDTVGISNENDVFIQNADTSIDKIDKGSDVVIKCAFEKDFYLFDGTPIKSFMTVGVQNYLGGYLEKDVILTLSGNVTFEDGTKTKEIKTSKTGISTIPIIVKTNTKFDCDIKIKKKEAR